MEEKMEQVKEEKGLAQEKEKEKEKVKDMNRKPLKWIHFDEQGLPVGSQM